MFAAGGEAPEFVAPPPEAEALPQASQLDAFMDSAPRRMIPVDAPGAAVVVVKFNDYQCPPCGNTFQAYKPLKAKWDKEAPGKVKFVTKDFPLEGGVQRRHPAGAAPDCLRGRRRGPHGPQERQGRSARGLAVRQPADPDASTG